MKKDSLQQDVKICIMIDKDMQEMNAVRDVFPNAVILLCWFHVLQSIDSWSGRMEGMRNEVVRSMIKLKQCTTQGEFSTEAENVLKHLCDVTRDTHVSDYLKENWLPIANMWSQFGRQMYHGNSETNNLSESLKYQFMGANANRRLGQLLLLLSNKVVDFYRYIDELHKVGRIQAGTNPAAVSDSSAKKMIDKGLSPFCNVKDNGDCSVPSEHTEGKFYSVSLTFLTCPFALLGNVCKYIEFAKSVGAKLGVDVLAIRKKQSQLIVENKSYTEERDYLVVHCDDCQLSIVCNGQCSCRANRFGETCVCLLVQQFLHDTQSKKLETPIMEAQSSDPVPETTTSNQLSTSQMIVDLNAWSNSPNFKDTMELHCAVKKKHT
ncbi:hypothetical protein AOXY_G2296 [Acipenser oxyrinchus oxyrinchus]|uniref:SWIM-type domain-containing protein n=1 Tax=Acipenser oxyrinchus oxyrinchus TaxID=40147 RepID=A0AAD8GIH3_ACIOX|nr:hypothetical protein AOXY_G2296 [Acipenser oxyrinchus oxyrinchus]